MGGFFGKVGSVVGASWKGIEYIRSLPTSMRNPRTAGQVKQRNRFSVMVKFLTQFTPLVQVGFKNYASKQSPFNAAMSYNMLNAVNGSGAEAEILYPKVMFSRGSLYAPANGSVSLLGNEISINWDTTVAGNASVNDEAMVFI